MHRSEKFSLKEEEIVNWKTVTLNPLTISSSTRKNQQSKISEESKGKSEDTHRRLAIRQS